MSKTNPRAKSWQERLLGAAPYISFGLILIAVPPFFPSYLQSLTTKVLIFAIFAMSLDLIFGYTGLWSLGHAAFFGTAGYTFAILATSYRIDSFWLVALTGVVIATLLAAFFGVLALRVSGLYFMMVTFALAMFLYQMAWSSVFLGGMGGLPVVRPSLGIPWFTWNEINLYYLVFVVFAISYFILHRIVNSPFGRALEGIRDDEDRMRHLGYNTWLHKYIAFIIAGLFAGVAGVLFAPYNRLIDPARVGFITSVLAMLYVMIGGVGRLFGAIIGAGVIVFVEFGAGMYTPERWPLILGGVFILVIMFLPDGIAPYLLRFWNRVKARYKYRSS